MQITANTDIYINLFTCTTYTYTYLHIYIIYYMYIYIYMYVYIYIYIISSSNVLQLNSLNSGWCKNRAIYIIDCKKSQ